MHFEHQYAGKPAQPINVGEPPLLWRCRHAIRAGPESHKYRYAGKRTALWFPIGFCWQTRFNPRSVKCWTSPPVIGYRHRFLRQRLEASASRRMGHLATAPSTSRRANAEKATFLDHADFDSGNCDRNFIAQSCIRRVANASDKANDGDGYFGSRSFHSRWAVPAFDLSLLSKT